MKRLFVILALVASSVFSSSFAAGTKTSPVVVESFEMFFSDAAEISWEQVGVLSKATFVLDGQYQSAFFNRDGELVAVTKNVSSVTLPKALRANLKKELNGSWITDLFVVTIEGENTYYVTIEDANTTTVLKSTGAKKWMAYQKTQK
jgi:hypothetical protein